MRVDDQEIAEIRSTVEAHFGPGSAIWFFGSALDDQVTGGDVDLYVEMK